MKRILSIALLLAGTTYGQTALFIPPAISGTTFNLNIQTGTRTFFSGYTTPTYGVNGSFLAPTLILNKLDSVTLNVTNSLPVATTIHWHGMHVSPQNDGGPGQLIAPSTTWSPSFKVLNDAGTYWYHPHGAGKTDLHVSKGIAGMIIVKDAAEAALTLPRTYGVDDIPLIVQSKAFDVLRQIAIATEDDTLLMVNGTVDPYLNAPAQVVRFRILNGSSMRSYMFGFSGSMPFKLIATDGGLLDTPVTLTRIRLSPGERAEVLLNLTGMVGATVYFKNYGSELPNGIYGADTVGTDTAFIPGYSANPLNGADYNIMKINVTASTGGAVTTIPATLGTLAPWPLSAVDTTRTFNLSPATADSSTFAEGPFVINGHHFAMDTINVVTYLNRTEIWKLVNHTLVAHPFHIHDVPFYIVDINGVPPPPYERGRKDVVLVMPGDSVRFITKFETFADASIPYMYHCHLLHHEDDGMMGQFLVLPGPAGISDATKKQEVQLSPNPATDILTLTSELFLSGSFSVKVYSLLGTEVAIPMEHSEDKLRIRTGSLQTGLYVMKIFSNNNVYVHKFEKL